MNLQTVINKGLAILTPTGLRCQAPRLKQPGQVCNKLVVKKNSVGQVAGSFKCERCKQEIEIQLKSVQN